MTVERPYKYEIKAKITTGHDPILKEDWTQIVPEKKITGDQNLEYNEETGIITVFTNKKQTGLQEVA